MNTCPRRIVSKWKSQRIANRDQIPVWGDVDRFWPPTPRGWEDEDVNTDAYGGVWAKEYLSTDAEVRVTIDLSNWVTRKDEDASRVRVEWSAKYWGKTDQGTFPVEGYERTIPKVLNDVRADADQAKERLIQKLERLGGNFDGTGLVFTKEDEDASMVIEFEDVLDVASGVFSDADVSIHYSKGADYQGHYGEERKRLKYRALDDIPKVLRDVDRLWNQWSKA